MSKQRQGRALGEFRGREHKDTLEETSFLLTHQTLQCAGKEENVVLNF